MELELRTISLIPGRREAIASLSPAAAAARAADAASHPACPSHGTVTLLLGHALARGALPDGDCGGPGGSDGAALAAMRLRRERFLDALHRWWATCWATWGILGAALGEGRPLCGRVRPAMRARKACGSTAV
jgi:hypothetical protein